MEVIATKPGYFGKLRQPDEKFEVPDGSKATWFAPVKTEAVRGKKPPATADKPVDDLV